MAKDKKKKAGKKGAKSDVAAKASKRLKALSANPLVADIVAAALVGAAAALKDAKKARQLAAHAGDELETLAKQGAERGGAMWQLALDIGRRSLESLSSDGKSPKAKTTRKATKTPKTKTTRKGKAAPKARKAAAPKSAAPKAERRAAPKAKARPAKRQSAARR